MQQRTNGSGSPAGRPPGAGGPPGMGGGGGGKMNFQSLGRAISYVGHYKRLAVWAYGALILATLAQLVIPQLIQNVIDDVVQAYAASRILGLPEAAQAVAAQQLGTTLPAVQDRADAATATIVTVMLSVAGFAVLRALFAFAQSFTAEQVSQSTAFDFRRDLFSKISRLSFSYHDKNQTGQLMIRATDDVEKVRLFIGQGLLMTAQALVLFVGALIVLWFTNSALTLVILPLLPLAFIVFTIFGRVSQPLFFAVQMRVSRLNTILQENMAGMKVVKAFAREPQEQVRFNAAAQDLFAQQIRVSRVFSFLFPVIFLLSNIGQAAILYFGGRQIIEGTLTLGEWQKFSLYLIYVFFPLGQLGMIINLMAQASASAARIFEILDAKNEVEDKPGAYALADVRGEVEFSGVTFRYFPGGEPVLNNVSFTATPGQTIALLGATGSGKTTIINLIPRFYDASEGKVMIDGHDVRDVTLDSLREHIGIVLQETTLFTGTIRDNIAFGRPEATDAEVQAAAQAAAAHDFIMGFPQGYATPVGERGSTLSGGQKQRIAIARALLLNPRILILDDSTSSVDLATEYRIQQALDRLMEGRTSFVIAQRISTVRNASMILVLDKGRIVARGTHEELLESSEIYSEIYNSQLLDDADAEAAEAAPAEKVGASR